jgi:hypothetical protein
MINFRKPLEINKRGLPLLLRLFLILLVYIIAWIALPIVRSYANSSPFKLIFLLIGVICLLVAASFSARWLNDYIKYYLFSFFIIVFIILTHYLFNHYDGFLLNLVDYMLVILFIGIGLFLIYIDNQQLDKWILIIFMVAFIITTITTLTNLLININYSRLLASSSTSEEITQILRRKNIGSFDFIYGILVGIPALLILVKNKIGKKAKFILIINLILGTLCVLNANFTTAYLILGLNILVIILPNRIGFNKFIPLFLFCFLALIYIGKSLIIFALNISLNYINSIMTQQKIFDIINFLNGKTSLNNVTSRSGLIQNSIESFSINPLFGVGAYYNSFDIVGGHSQLIDEIARYGILGCFFMFMPIILFVITTIRKLNSNWSKKAYAISFMFYLILGIVNPIFGYFISLLFYIILPTLIRYYDRYNNVKLHYK